ncbi:MAG: nitrogen regulation protein NR(II) [Gemmatimonadota bacterium]
MLRPLPSSLGALDERRLLTGVYIARLSMANALALAATVVRTTGVGVPSPIPLVVLIVGIPLAWTAGSLLWARRWPIGRAFLAAQIIHDLLLISTAILLTGGVGSEFAFIYVLLIAVAGLLMGFSGGVLTALWSAAAYLAIAWWQIAPLLPAEAGLIELPNLSGQLVSILWSLALVAVVFLVVGLASGLAATRLRAQRARLAELEEQLADARIDAEDILNTVESGILSINAEEEIDFVNYTARAQLGLSGVPVASELRDADEGGLAALYQLLLTTLRSEREGEESELKLPDAAGRQRPFHVATTVLYDPRGRKKGAAAILKDVEHVQRLEELVRQAERLKAVAELAAGLAHEIRNPLAAIRSAVELLGGDGRPVDAEPAGATSGEDSGLRDLIVRETDRLTALIGDFMSFSSMTLRSRVRLDLADVIEDAVEVDRVSAGSAAPGVVFTRPLRPNWVEGDHNLLKQVCLNLLANARTAVNGTRQARIEVRLGGNPQLPGLERASGPYVALEVRDNGPGVGADVRDRIFDPFFTTRPSGFGMGLAIVHRIVDLHGGMVWVDSAAGEGSTFRIALPRAS